MNEEIYRAILWNGLVNLGGITKLGFRFNCYNVLSQLSQFDNNWVLYNKIKDTNNNRWGLPLTSKTGDVDDNEHLNSFMYVMKNKNLMLSESDYTTPTQVYHALPEIANIINVFTPDIGRVHLLRIDRGGFWPPHRDFQSTSPEYFRLLAFFGNCSTVDFKAIFNEQLINFEQGVVYFVNTQLEHSVFSFTDGVYCLVLTVKLTERTSKLIFSNLETY